MSADFLDTNVPGNPAYHFTIQPPTREGGAGWLQRPALIPGAGTATQCVHGGVQPDPAYGAVMPPLYLSSTFAFKDICTNAGYDYTRSGNPTRAALEEAIALLEGGSGATCTSTGMSAILVALNLLPHGSHLISTVDCYGGTFRLLEHAQRFYGLEVTYLDLADLPAVAAAMRPNTRMLWIETPSNPLLRLTDIAAVAALGHRQPDCLVAVDNTFLSPFLQRPFDLGADLATPHREEERTPALRIVDSQVERLEREIDALNADLAPLTSFVLPGGSDASAALHLARTVCRRAERTAVAFADGPDAAVHAAALRYLNRLSDLLFVAARFANDGGAGDVLWAPAATR